MQVEMQAVRAPLAAEPGAQDKGPLIRRWATVFCALIIAAIIANLILQGLDYYRLPLSQRYRSPLHAELKPGGSTGRMLGISGSLMMITLLSYSLRKRVNALRNWGKLSTWLHVHIFLGVAGPLLITFHTAFKLRGIVAISYWSMMIVAISGALGRYLYAQIPRAISGAELQSKEILQQLMEINSRLEEWLDPANLRILQQITATEFMRSGSLLAAVPLMLRDDFRWWYTKRRLYAFARVTPGLTEFQRAVLPELAAQQRQQRRRIMLLKTSQDLFRYWHIFHLPLAKTMYLTMVIHVAVAMMTGYFWKN